MSFKKIANYKYKEKDYFKIKILIIFILIFWFLFLSYHILFSVKKYQFDFNSNKKYSILQKNSADNLDFFLPLTEKFSQVSISLISNKKNNKFLPPFYIYKTYEAMTYPLMGEKNDLKKEDLLKLVADNKTVYLIVHNKKFAIDNPSTFEAHNFQWRNVIPANKFNQNLSQIKTISLYRIKDPHPDGTVFWTTDTHKFYYIENGKRYLLTGSSLKISALKENAVPVQEKSLQTYVTCKPKKRMWTPHKYTCHTNLKKINNFSENYYRFENKNLNYKKFNQMEISFFYSPTYHNIRYSIVTLIHHIMFRFHIISFK